MLVICPLTWASLRYSLGWLGVVVPRLLHCFAFPPAARGRGGEAAYRYRQLLIGIDIGGTFTDVVFLDAERGAMEFLKGASTPGRLEEGVVAGLRRLGEKTGLDFRRVDRVVHGTTVATNALLQGRWARTALVTTAGFRDVIEIGRQNRPAIYNLSVERPRPIVSRDLRFEVSERLDYRGQVVMPLDEPGLVNLAEEMRRRDVESVAVCLLFSYANPDHERRVGEVLERRLGIPVTLSCDVLPEFREYERTQTVVINASLRPVMGDYLERLEGRSRELGLDREWQIMQSNAGITGSLGAQAEPVRMVLSGPAAGVEGARVVGEEAGFPDLITIDMGGTSCDVSLVRDGRAAVTTEGNIAGYPIKVPMVDINTIGAGGGSIAWIDKGSALRVGPQSAGAEPGPVCYGRGGTEPTVTDAHLVLGRLDPWSPVGELDRLDAAGARMAVGESVARPLGMSVEEAALGILAVAEANMERAIRVISVERGYDPRLFALLPFGGGGPLHGAALASSLGIGTVLVPETAGVLSALGLLQTDVAHDYVQSVLTRSSQVDPREVSAGYQRLRTKGWEDMMRDGVAEDRVRYQPSLDMRYVGQSFELNVGLSDLRLDAGSLSLAVEEFHRRHEQTYGHASPGEPVELVNLRLRAIGLVERNSWARGVGWPLEDALKGMRQVCFSGAGWLEAGVYDRDGLAADVSLDGPAIVEGRESTVVVPPGWYARSDKHLNLLLSRTQAGK